MLQSVSTFPLLLPLLNLGNNLQLQRLSFSVKVLCLSEIVTKASFPSTESEGLPPAPHPVLFLLVMFRMPSNLSELAT